MVSALSWGPPFLEPKNVTNQQFYKETCAQKKRCCVLLFCLLPRFSCIYFLKTKYKSAWLGSMLRGVQVWQRSRFYCTNFSENKWHGADTGSMLRGNRSPKSYTESQLQKGQCFWSSRGVPPSWSQKMLQINNSIRKLVHKKKEVVFCFFVCFLDFLVHTF